MMASARAARPWGMCMPGEEPFVDYYRVLEVDPGCGGATLDAAYRRLAKIFHPDHPETADADRFAAILEAHRALRTPQQRAAYDLRHAAQVHADPIAGEDGAASGNAGEPNFALGDDEVHARLLMALYRKRREDATQAGIGEYYLQDMLGCSDAHFAFHRWYLQSKGLIEVTEEGTLAITVAGVDNVIATSRNDVTEKLVIAQLRGPGPGR